MTNKNDSRPASGLIHLSPDQQVLLDRVRARLENPPTTGAFSPLSCQAGVKLMDGLNKDIEVVMKDADLAGIWRPTKGWTMRVRDERTLLVNRTIQNLQQTQEHLLDMDRKGREAERAEWLANFEMGARVARTELELRQQAIRVWQDQEEAKIALAERQAKAQRMLAPPPAPVPVSRTLPGWERLDAEQENRAEYARRIETIAAKYQKLGEGSLENLSPDDQAALAREMQRVHDFLANRVIPHLEEDEGR